ncbi:MAG: hypothetical protein WBV21_06225 [Desulfobacterales bacterium]
MILKSYFPLIVAGYVVAVGLFFLSMVVAENALITLEPAGRPVLAALSIAFAVAGAVFALLFFKGHLKRSGITVKEVRMEAVAKLNAESMLADIALKDPDPDVRLVAQKRLEEIAK